MSLLFDSKKAFKRELRKYVVMFFTETGPVELSRQRGSVRQYLSDVRCCAVAVSSSAAQISSPSKDHIRQLAAANNRKNNNQKKTKKQKNKNNNKMNSSDINNNSNGTAKQLTPTTTPTPTAAPTTAAAATATATAEQSTRALMANSLSSMQSYVTRLPVNNNNKERLTEFDAMLLFADECVAGAQYLIEREMYKDAAELCLEPLEKEVLISLREAVVLVEERKSCSQFVSFNDGNELNNNNNNNNNKNEHFGQKSTGVSHNEDKNNDSVDDDSFSCVDGDKRYQRAVLLKMQPHVRELLPAWRLVVQFDILHHICQFYLLLNGDILLEDGQETVKSALDHLEAIVLRLLTVAAIDADDSYFTIFNGTITVYEMCLDVMQKAEDCIVHTLQRVSRYIALCLDMCETATLKLATVRYMPWRLRLYDYIAACYEKQGAYMEALFVAQRAYQKVRELVDVEMFDSVPPPEKSQEIMLSSLDHAVLNVLRYSWYVNNTSTAITTPTTMMSHTGGGGGGGGGGNNNNNNTSDGNVTFKQNQSFTVGLAATQLQPQLPLGDMPRNANDMIDLAWQLLLKVELSKHPAGVMSSTTQSSPRGGNMAKQQQQRQEILKKEQTAKRIQGALLRFLLSFVTEEIKIPSFTKMGNKNNYEESRPRGGCPLSFLRSHSSPFREWAIEALEFLTQRAVWAYLQVNPHVQRESGISELAEILPSPSIRQPSPSPASANNNNNKAFKNRKKNSLQRRSNRLQNTVAGGSSALQDDMFLANVTLENFLYNLALPNVEREFDTKETCGIKKLFKFETINEESLLLALLLHCVLYEGKNKKLFVCLCTCSLSSLRQKRRFDEQEELKDETITKTINKKILSLFFSKKVLQMRAFDIISASLSLLQNMCKLNLSSSMCINDLISTSQELEQVIELFINSKVSSVNNKIWQGKKKTVINNNNNNTALITIATTTSSNTGVTCSLTNNNNNNNNGGGGGSALLLPFLGTSKILFFGFSTLSQWLMEEGADFLLRCVSSFVPSLLKSVSFPNNNNNNNILMNMGKNSLLHEKNVERNLQQKNNDEDNERRTDIYHNIMWTCLNAKIKSEKTDAIKIGQLVLLYVQEVYGDISTDSTIVNNNNNNNGDGKEQNQHDTKCDISRTDAMGKIINNNDNDNDNSVEAVCTVDESMYLLRKKCNRARMALDAINMSLKCLEMLQTQITSPKRGGVRRVLTNYTTTTTGGGGHIAKILETEDAEKVEKENELLKICCENEIRDMRTELTRWLIELRCCFAIHREYYSSLEKYKADIKLLMDRQANRKVYGATTLKELNVLATILKTKPQPPRSNEDEKKRLLAWAREENDELLYALVLMCLASYQLHSKTQREMLEEAFRVLQRHKSNNKTYNNSGGGGGNYGKDQMITSSSLKQHGEGSAYSALMICCYAVTICGKLGFTNITNNAKDVLFSVFAKSDNDNHHSATTAATAEKEKEEEEILANKYEEKDNEKERKKQTQTNDSSLLNANVNKDDDVEGLFAQLSALAVQPNEEVLAASSALQIKTLALALLWVSTVEMRQVPYHNFDTSGIMSFTNKSILLDVPFKQRYGFSKIQLFYLRSAYRIEFAMQLASRVNDTGLLLQCAFELFNTLYPSLVDENYCSFLLQPLLILCEALLRQPEHVWGDAYVQRLAVCSIDALLKTLRKMSAAGSDAVINRLSTTTLSTRMAETTMMMTETLNHNTMDLLSTMPAPFQKWYGFLLQVFVHVWTLVYNHPNPRQLRYCESVRQEAIAVQRVLGASRGGAAEGVVNRSSAVSSVGTRSPSPTSRSTRQANATPAGFVTSNSAAPAFPGAFYATADFVFDDIIPIELLELLGDILFTVPGGAFFLSQLPAQWCEKTLAQTTTLINGASDALVGVPAWLLTVARALASKTPYAALECFQQVKNNPLYAKTAVYIVEYLLRQGDTATACRVATEALQTISDLHNSIREYQQTVVDNMNEWLGREGYMLVIETRSVKKVVPENQPVKEKQRKKRSVVKETTQTQEQVEVKAHEFSSSNGKQWTLGEQQMLRQLTRGFAWVRRRRALRWVRSRFLQFTAPYRAQLEFYLSVCAQQSIEHRRRQLQEGHHAAAAAAAAAAPPTSAAAAAAATKTRSGAKAKARVEDTAAAVAARTEELRKEEEKDKERFVKHAARAAVLFNRCGFPSRAFMAISQAIDGLRVFVCEEPPDMTLPSEELLKKGSSVDIDNSSKSASPTRHDSFGRSVSSVAASVFEKNSIETVTCVAQTLQKWGPRVIPLARALHEMLVLIWAGFFDNRRDVEFLQPSAVKVWRDVLLEEQLHFQGRVPSLQVHTSPSGQYEEARLAHLAAVNRVRLAQSLRWRAEEVESAESCGRVNVHVQWLSGLLELLAAHVDKFGASLPLEPHVALVEQAIAALTKQDGSKTEAPQQNKQQQQQQQQSQEQQQEALSAKKKMLPNVVKKKAFRAAVQRSSIPDVNCSSEMIALRLGPALPAEKVISNFMFLMRYMQFGCKLASLELSLETHKLTKGFFASELLPFVLSLQWDIGVLRSGDLVAEYANLHQNESMQKLLVQNSQRMWEEYTMTEAYSRVMNRLTRTLLPSRRSAIGTYVDSTMSVVDCDTVSKDSEQTQSNAKRMVHNKGATCVTVRDVVSSFETATTFMRERRLFGPLAERLYKLGHIHFLHRQRVDAERCWLEAVDAALEMPESLKKPTSVWTKFSAATVGFPRLLLAVLSLSSLAMYIYREQQGKAVDASLLAARILERFFEQCTTSNFPRQLRDFGGFVVEDIIVLPHLGDCLLTLMPQIVHHMLFLAWGLLKFKFYFYAAMVASLTEHLARVHTRHVAFTVEARLVQAIAASYFGNHRASMKLLRNVCQGVRIPSLAIDGTGLCVRAAVEFVEASKPVKGGKRVDNAGAAGSSYRINDQQPQQQQQLLSQSRLEFYSSPEGLYNDAELPVTPGNVSCVQTFVAHCFKEKSIFFPVASPSTSQSFYVSPTATLPLAGNNSSVLHEAVVACYGLRLSQRVELAVAESLTALGLKEAAYLWCTFAGNQRPGTGEKRAMRLRGAFSAIPLHGVGASACLEALAAAESILHSLLMRLGERYGAHVDGSNTTTTGNTKKSPMREKRNLPIQRGLQEKCIANMEEIYIRCTSELLLAKIYAARGECTRAMILLQGLIVRFNESAGENISFAASHSAPSYLWTATTHTFWCSVYELMVRIHIRLHEYVVAQQVIRDALALCEQCGDPYSGRVFSLYEAAITARGGNIAKATETLYALEKVSHSLKIDGRDDMLHAWILMGTESLEYAETQCVKRGTFSSSVERLEFAVQALQKYCEMHGLLPDCLSLAAMKLTQSPSTAPADGVVREKQQRSSPVAWNVTVVFLHQAINLLANEYMRLGKLHLAEELLRHAVSNLSLQYDSSAHPTPLIESSFMLARLLCMATPSLLTKQQRSKELTEAEILQELMEEENVLRALDPPRREPVQLFMDVVCRTVTSGTHDYTILRQALLYLALLLSRAGRLFYCLAANCVVLAKLVEDMQFHVFSGTSVFSLYSEENIQLGSDVNFVEDIIAVVQSTRRGLGNVTEKESTGAVDYVATPVSQRVSPEFSRLSPRIRGEKEESNQKNNVTLPIIISAFASLHRKSSLRFLFPPLESLDLETALQHVRAFLQLKTAPLCSHYMWYHNTTVTDAFIKQPTTTTTQQQQQQQHVVEGVGRGFLRGSLTAADANTAGTAAVSLLPPIVINKLPPLLSFRTLAQLGIPKVNTIICQSFFFDADKTFSVCEGNQSPCRGAKKEKTITHVEPSFIPKSNTLTFSLLVSPIYDPTVTQPPPLNEKNQPNYQSKKQARNLGKNALSTVDAKNSVSLTPIEPLWCGTRCVVFELPGEELQSLLSQAEHTMQLMENSANSTITVTGENVEEKATAEAVLSQQLNEAMAVLNAKATPPTNSKKGSRSAPQAEFVVSLNTTPASNIIVGVTTSAEVNSTTVADIVDEIPALDEAKSKLITGFIELFVRSIIPSAVVDYAVMERSVQSLLPHCAITVDVVSFLRSIAAGNCSSVSLFHPGIYEWFSRIANFVIEHT